MHGKVSGTPTSSVCSLLSYYSCVTSSDDLADLFWTRWLQSCFNFQCLHSWIVADVGSPEWSSDGIWMPLLGLVLFLLWSSALCLFCLGYTFCSSKHILKYIFHKHAYILWEPCCPSYTAHKQLQILSYLKSSLKLTVIICKQLQFYN